MAVDIPQAPLVDYEVKEDQPWRRISLEDESWGSDEELSVSAAEDAYCDCHPRGHANPR